MMYTAIGRTHLAGGPMVFGLSIALRKVTLMDFAIGFFLGLAVGILYVGFIDGRSYRDELRRREEWEQEARQVLRGVARGEEHAIGFALIARRLIADEEAA